MVLGKGRGWGRIFRAAAIGAVFVVFSLFASAETAQAGVLSPGLQERLKTSRPGEEIPVIITISPLTVSARGGGSLPAPPAGRRVSAKARQGLIQSLQERLNRAQQDLSSQLAALGARKVKAFWIADSLAAEIPAFLLATLKDLPQVKSISLDSYASIPAPVLGDGAPAEWNVQAVRAPELWALEITGSGIVVATLDSGVDLLHPDLQGRWRGGTNSWYDPYGVYPTPADPSGHGTGTMSVILGGDAGGSAIGVAPNASWISARVFEVNPVTQELEATVSTILSALQWLMDPDGNPATDDGPHLVSNSWGFETPDQCLTGAEYDALRTALENLRTAGVAVVFSAGNSGPNPATSISPANYGVGLAVGAVDVSRNIASFSSRGPSACDGALFPDLAAPGVNVRTADLTFGGVFPNSYIVWSGTSLSAPHAAGAVALLLSAIPDAPLDEIEWALTRSAADLGGVGPDNTFGFGLVDAFSAYQMLVNKREMVQAYYLNILGRAPEPGGAEGWIAELNRLIPLGVDVQEGFISMGKYFFNSPEYLSRGRTDAQYVTDLYQSFLSRAPSQTEVDFWVGYLTGGASRNITLNFFVFSPEFSAYIQGIFGASASRPENNLVNDFYRGILSRLPDTPGFNFWLGLMRTAQCAGAQAVQDLSYRIALGFIQSAEYTAKARTNAGFVEDLYDGIMRRSGDSTEVNYWVGVLNAATMTRQQALQFFTGAPEFQNRVTAVINAGCL